MREPHDPHDDDNNDADVDDEDDGNELWRFFLSLTLKWSNIGFMVYY